MRAVWMRKSILFKVFLILLGISMPLWLGVEEVGLYRLMGELRVDPDGNTLMLAAFVLVMLNTIRALPHYLGALLLGDELGYRFHKPWLKVIIPVFIIPAVYLSINSYSPLNYHFGGPALLLLLSILLLHILGKGRLRPILKSFVLVQILFGIQWLDTVTLLSAYGFGGGPISSELKSIAINIDYGFTLSLYSLMLCSIFVVNAVVLAVYLTVSEQKWKISRDLDIVRGEVIASRSGREVLHLVHDLKTPLALIEGLNSLIELKTKDKEIKEYTENISESITSTSNMVSEILYQEKKNWCSLKRLIEYIRANKIDDHAITFTFELEADEQLELFINKIRITRAVVNLIDNACDAVSETNNPTVIIRTALIDNELWLGVLDNGKGISKKDLKKIYQPGFSTKSHPGVGLTFVNNVIEVHQARMKIENRQGNGTAFWMIFPEEVLRYEYTDH
ncbi:sensor histidine kinase [Thalassobacillus pellis]|uniref:sensor histidine kinase n=1 Tax=Thalassobacillus pellis TaxID=748008 RepID=UPI001EF9029D|nr:HAMP domain-containing sensor histidine kinase [Thalassobacillus pellis]MBM7553163.1 signal transduction histidine kinase [Thalassobacillus pellis]